MQHGATKPSIPPPLYPALTVEDAELVPLTRAHGVGRTLPPPLPKRVAVIEVTTEDLLPVFEEDLTPITAAQWIH